MNVVRPIRERYPGRELRLTGGDEAASIRCPAFGVLHPVEPNPRRQVELRPSAAPAFRDDLNHPVRRLRAVKRRCRGTLDDFDAFDIGGIHVVQTALIGTAALTDTVARI